MRGTRLRTAVLVGLTLFAGAVRAARADVESDAIARAADELVARDDAGPGDASLDRWMLAEALLERGRRDVAVRVAEAAPPAVRDRLLAYVGDAQVGASPVREALRALRAAVAAGRAADALATAVPDAGGAEVSAALLRLERARLRVADRRHADAVAEAAAAGDLAETVGAYGLAVRARHLEATATLYVSPARSLQRWAALGRLARPAGDPRIEAVALEGAATARERFGDVHGATEDAGRAVTLRAALGEPGPWARAEAVYGAVLLRAGRLTEAREALRRASERADASADPATVVAALAGLGTVRLVEGDASLAKPLLERAVRLARGLDDAEQAARALVNLATARRRLGDTAGALDDLRVAEEMFLRTGDEPGRVRAVLGAAVLRADLGDVDGARSAAEDALRLARAVGDREAEALARVRVGGAMLAAGDAAGGARELGDAVQGLEAVGSPLGRDAEAARRAVLAARPEDASPALREVAQARAAAQRRGDAALAARFLFQEAALRHTAHDLAAARAAYAEASREADHLHDARLAAAALGGLARVHLDEGDAATALAVARDTVTRVEALVRGLSDGDGALARSAWADVFETGLEAAAVAGDLDAGLWFAEASRAGALLEALGGREAVEAAAVPAAVADAAKAAREADAAARTGYDAAVARGAPLAELRTLRTAQLEAAARWEAAEAALERASKRCQAFYPRPVSLAAVRASLAEGDVLLAYERARGALACRVVHRDGARRVELGVVEDVLARAGVRGGPDAPLPEPTAARRALVDPVPMPPDARRLLVVPCEELLEVPFQAVVPGRDVVLLPSASAYVFLQREAEPAGDGVLGVGDPATGVPSDAPGAPRGSVLVSLPGSRAEVLASADTALVGADATVDGLRRALATRARWRVVLLACHGEVDALRPAQSALRLAPTASHDGRLRVGDLLSWRVPADLVVLSACESGRGTPVRGEGLVGLARAMMHAGAPRVIASLRRVDDDATRALMTTLHERLRAGVSPARALREAQARVRAEPRWRAPAYWAPWVLWGLP
ncbi:MAG: CHAT domain-containing protein [Planctomycetes bacterium]|nr:CHAT domain-containing protein [Planctomycetota bacterium]